MKSCVNPWCGQPFDVTDEDLAFYDEISPVIGGKKFPIPPPTRCPDCRRQQRLLFRNFFNLYHRTCDLSGKKILSAYHRDAPFPVYETSEWWSDKWDGKDYGLDVDFSGSAFDQMQVLHQSVPRMNVINVLTENCDYCNMSIQCRNCYLMFGNVGNEDCFYGHIVWQSKNCFDCLYCYKCELCYECIDCVQCHSLRFSRDCDNCADSMFLVHCVGCSDCFGCVALQNKQYCIFNEQHSQEDYRRKIDMLNPGNKNIIAVAKKRVLELTGREVVKNYHGFNCEHVTGDYLYNCRNIVEGYDLKNCEDCRYCATMESFTDSMDCNFSGATSKSELCYNCLTVGGGSRVFCSHSCMDRSSDLYYCDNCHACRDCFGCVGLKGQRYCMYNKQYTEREYKELLPTLIEHMQKTGKWGEFFPTEFSPFAYNETIAQEYFPCTESETTARGWRWRINEEEVPDQSSTSVVQAPDDIRDATDDITKHILQCRETGKPYKITQQELEYYRSMRIPLPQKHFMQRQRERFAVRNPRHLWNRTCTKCKCAIQTTYAPDRPETVYCEDCFLKEVY